MLLGAQIDEVKELLDEFGLVLHGVNPGVQAFLGARKLSNRKLLVFEAQEWDWLKPLLIELRDRRNSDVL